MQEYAHAFNYLSQYAKDDVSTDEKKQYQFMKGLSKKLKSHLSAHDFNDFNHMVNKAIKSEHDVNALEADNRKRAAPSSYGGSSQRARTGPTPAPRVLGYGAPQLCGWPVALRILKVKFNALWDNREAVVEMFLEVHVTIAVGKVIIAGSVPLPRKVELVMFQISPLILNPTTKPTKMDKLPSEAG